MTQQSFENHTRHDKFLYTLSACAILLGCAMRYLGHQVNTVAPLHGLQYIVPVFVPLFFISWMVRMRSYATKLQDRIIRLEVQFRYFLSTGKQLPSDITLGQMVALRFASDHEFAELADKAAHNKNFSKKDIKAAIKNWKADTHRV